MTFFEVKIEVGYIIQNLKDQDAHKALCRLSDLSKDVFKTISTGQCQDEPPEEYAGLVCVAYEAYDLWHKVSNATFNELEFELK